jgi:hypothetical protein
VVKNRIRTIIILDSELPVGQAANAAAFSLGAASLERHLLDCILGRLALAEHGQGKPVCGLDERPQDGLEGVSIASAGALEQV